DEHLKAYMGTKAPDLSMMIRAKNVDYLNIFMNEPQKLLANTPMPRVGLTQKAQNQVIDYLESVGDSKKDERENLGLKIILFTLAMAGVAYLWKVKIWREVE
ncbi:MAG: cytochrome c1, partial [Campylobacteraceae bacterium]|nr:cytochrome c1 [Campylobacteraceae bacterium]